MNIKNLESFSFLRRGWHAKGCLGTIIYRFRGDEKEYEKDLVIGKEGFRDIKELIEVLEKERLLVVDLK